MSVPLLSLKETPKIVSLRENTGNRLCAKKLINLRKIRGFADIDVVENNRNYVHNNNVLAVTDFCLFSTLLKYLEGRSL